MAWHCHRTPPGWLFLVDLSCRSFFDGVFKFTGTPLCVQSEMLVILSSLFKQINMDSQCGVQTQVSQLSLPLLQSSLINWRNPGALGVRCDEFGPLSSVTTVNTADLHAPILINHAWSWQRSVSLRNSVFAASAFHSTLLYSTAIDPIATFYHSFIFVKQWWANALHHHQVHVFQFSYSLQCFFAKELSINSLVYSTQNDHSFSV